MFANWPEVATNDKAIISRWWQQNPTANVGIATGKRSGVFVVDVDPKNGGYESYETLLTKHGQFPDTWQQITGSKGMHLFFRYPTFPVSNAAGLMPGIDIRGDGGQVVAPPSIHPVTGDEYVWDGLDEIERVKLAEAPLWLLEILGHKESHHGSSHFPVPDRIPHGVQHYTLLALAGALRKMGLTDAEMLPTMQEVNSRRCTIPGDARNVQQIAASVMKYQPADNDLFRTATKLYRLTKAKEHEAQEREERIGVATVDGLTVYRSSGLDMRCIIPGMLYNGLTIFAGRPKTGKSWLTLQLALAIAEGRQVIGQSVHSPGVVLYVALEESQARTASRMRKLKESESVFLQNISMVYSLDPLGHGGAEQLDKIIAERRPTVVIIDTFLALVGGSGKTKDVMRAEYSEIDTIRKIGAKHETAMVLVHHQRKSVPGESGIDAVAGTTGITAAADAIWSLTREDRQTGLCSLEIVGREVEEQTFGLRFNRDSAAFGWEMIGTGQEVRAMKDEREIMTCLQTDGQMIPARLASALRMNVNLVRSCLLSMEQRGLVAKLTSGAYRIGPIYQNENTGGDA